MPDAASTNQSSIFAPICINPDGAREILDGIDRASQIDAHDLLLRLLWLLWLLWLAGFLFLEAPPSSMIFMKLCQQAAGSHVRIRRPVAATPPTITISLESWLLISPLRGLRTCSTFAGFSIARPIRMRYCHPPRSKPLAPQL
ncbi:MAG: hypothetical protein Q9203_002748 [Teloschistes exilis]